MSVAEVSVEVVAMVRGVTHTYVAGSGVTTVLDDVSLDVGLAELVVLAGRSGSGKSTLCHIVAGLTRPTRGAATVVGAPAHEVNDWAKVALMPQRGAIAEELTIAENVGLPRLLRGLGDDRDLLERLGLGDIADRPAAQTSLGEQQRAALGRALALAPALAVLDEPTGHQDDEHVDLMLAALQEAGSAGTALLVATHDERVIAIADRVVRLEAGQVVS